LPPTAVLMRLKQFANQLSKSAESPGGARVCGKASKKAGQAGVEKTAELCR